jgi:hypothetical protein
MIPAVTVIAVRPHDDDAFVIARSDDQHRHAVIVRTVSVISGGRVSMVVRPPNHDLAVEIGIAEAERNPDTSLSLCDTGGEAE